MIQVNIYQAKTELSRLLRRVRAGNEVIIADAGRPVARLVPIAGEGARRVLGEDVDKLWIADDFDAPLAREVLARFYGGELPARVRASAPRKRRAARKPSK